MQDMPMPDWISYEGKPVMTVHHRSAVQDPYASKEDARNFTEGWFSKAMPDMNQANPYAGELPDPEYDLVDRVRGPVRPAHRHLRLFKQALPH
jgi:hypothetical protein